MGTFLLLIFLIFIVYPIVAISIKIHRFKRQARKAYEQAYRQATGQQPGKAPGRKAGWDNSGPRRKKKIDPAVGEYVKYEEIEVDETRSDSSSSTRVRISREEQQISDVEWEDIDDPR